jgi:hypothetical protein
VTEKHKERNLFPYLVIVYAGIFTGSSHLDLVSACFVFVFSACFANFNTILTLKDRKRIREIDKLLEEAVR